MNRKGSNYVGEVLAVGYCWLTSFQETLLTLCAVDYTKYKHLVQKNFIELFCLGRMNLERPAHFDVLFSFPNFQ